jgi:hypothetical protein
MLNRTFVYVDGFNLYYRALAKKPNKWLSLYALATRMLPGNDIVGCRKRSRQPVEWSRLLRLSACPSDSFKRRSVMALHGRLQSLKFGKEVSQRRHAGDNFPKHDKKMPKFLIAEI